MKTDIGYIYSLESSRDNEIRYIGFTINPRKRLNGHISESKELRCHRHYWIQKERKEGYKILMKFLKIVSFDNWIEEEIKMIDEYKSLNYNLTNTHQGGNGGFRTSEERKLRKPINLGNTWNKGRKPCEENLRLLDIARRKPKTKEHYNKILESKRKNNTLSKKPSYSKETVIEIFNLFNNYVQIKHISTTVKLPINIIANILYLKNTAKDVKEKYNLVRTRSGNNKRN